MNKEVQGASRLSEQPNGNIAYLWPICVKAAQLLKLPSVKLYFSRLACSLFLFFLISQPFSFALIFPTLLPLSLSSSLGYSASLSLSLSRLNFHALIPFI